MNHGFENLSTEELTEKLKELYELLEDTEELRMMQLGQTGHHISSKLVTEYAKELAKINENIFIVKELLTK